MAGNCLIFGIRTLEAADTPVTNRAVRGLAIGAATVACGIHAFSRRGGIWLGNVFALVKVCMLLMMIIVGICAWGGAFDLENYARENLAAENSFARPASDSYGYVKAFLSMIFAWSGFDQPNYVWVTSSHSLPYRTLTCLGPWRDWTAQKNVPERHRNWRIDCHLPLHSGQRLLREWTLPEINMVYLQMLLRWLLSQKQNKLPAM
jgi:hypothetical protein